MKYKNCLMLLKMINHEFPEMNLFLCSKRPVRKYFYLKNKGVKEKCTLLLKRLEECKK